MALLAVAEICLSAPSAKSLVMFPRLGTQNCGRDDKEGVLPSVALKVDMYLLPRKWHWMRVTVMVGRTEFHTPVFIQVVAQDLCQA